MKRVGGVEEGFRAEGSALFPGEISSAVLDPLIDEFQRLIEGAENVHSVRGVLAKSDAVQAVASQLAPLADALLGSVGSIPTKGTFFDRTEDTNWSVPWHQDLTITVDQRASLPGFRHWRAKEGLWHTQPPRETLERIVALRIHLDDCPEEHGALRVLPGSHREGVLSTEAVTAAAATREARLVPARRGDVHAMAPLLLHSSGKWRTTGAGSSARHRRVLHLEFSDASLPAPLTWSA